MIAFSLVTTTNDGGAVLKRWVGCVVAGAAALVMVSPAGARADFDRVVCPDVNGRITGMTGVGPGLVAVEGWLKPRTVDPATCDAQATLTAYAGVGNAGYWTTDGETGKAAVQAQDGRYTWGLNVGTRTFAVCLEAVDGRPIDCYQVTVPGGDDATRGPAVGTPIVAGRINVHGVPVPPPPPGCGHCM